MALLFWSSSIVFSQEDFPRHQVSINASKFFLLFNEQVNNLDLTYRGTLAKNSVNLRAATSIDIGTAEGDFTNYSVRLGIDKVFKVSGRWKFYTGLDANYGKTEAKSTERITTKIGVIPFIGFLYHFGTHFSVSTEPSLAIFRNESIDNNSFNPESNSTDFSFNLINIGQIKLGFHF